MTAVGIVLIGSIATAVSIEFTTFTATKIGTLTTIQGSDYTESRIEFSGPGLKPLMKTSSPSH